MSPRHPTIASGAIRKGLATLAELGVGPADVCAEIDLDLAAAEDPDARFPLTTLYDLWEAVLRRRPLSDGAAIAAQQYAPGDYGLVGFVAMNSATLGEALGHVVRYVGLWTDDPAIVLDDEGTLRLAHRSRVVDRPGWRAATESFPAEILNGARLLTQTRVCPIEVRFAHAAPPDASALESFFGCPVRFALPSTSMVLRRADLDLPLPKADVQLGAYLRGLANDALARRSGSSSPERDRVREIVAEELPKGLPTLERVARRMATSERTLRRRLGESGSSFRELLDDTRAELARSYVRDRRLPLSEVAFLLGFSEPSGFHRAFKRWTRTTPSAFRRRSG